MLYSPGVFGLMPHLLPPVSDAARQADEHLQRIPMTLPWLLAGLRIRETGCCGLRDEAIDAPPRPAARYRRWVPREQCARGRAEGRGCRRLTSRQLGLNIDKEG